MMEGHADGLAGWILWPVGEYVARRGMDTPERALTLLHAMTQRFTAEFALRPFVLAHPSLVFHTLSNWVNDPSEHVRRLVSEGTRPRLPWGIQLKPLIADPSPALPLLDALLDDPSPYVRRSVANHLNDIARDHPALVTAFVERHLPGASAERRALLKHASRTLIKQGDVRLLHAWGMGQAFRGTVALALSPKRLALGGSVQLTVTVTSRARTAQALTIDYRVHHRKANGEASPKVFKGWVVQLAPGATVTLTKRHAVKPITTRRYYAGRHVVDVQVNGTIVADAAFQLTTG
jgi:3-methyladenine DNA glycosylase AlkC